MILIIISENYLLSLPIIKLIYFVIDTFVNYQDNKNLGFPKI